MLRIDAYPVSEGLTVRIAGVCTGLYHIEPRCECAAVQRTSSLWEIEHYGTDQVLIEALLGILSEYPGLLDRMYH
jgi:hypothetical protein